jgi:hypothetical protein
MGGSNSVIYVDSLNLTTNSTINLNEYKCSDRGLVLPSKLIYSNFNLKVEII